MSTPKLDRSHDSSPLSMIGGAAQGGSAKPKEEREKLDRKHDVDTEETPAQSGTPKREGTVGGNSNDNRTDEERRSGS